MPIDPEAVTQAGSGLTSIAYYDASVTDAYRSAIITAEHELQSHFTNQTTIGVTFDLKSLANTSAAANAFSLTPISYTALANALRAHAVSADDLLAVNGLPAADPSGGVGFSITPTQARILSPAAQTNSDDDHVSLNSNLPWSFDQDAVAAIEHEITSLRKHTPPHTATQRQNLRVERPRISELRWWCRLGDSNT